MSDVTVKFQNIILSKASLDPKDAEVMCPFLLLIFACIKKIQVL